MNIQWIFHSLALLAGIVATACGLLSSHNKLVLFIAFALVAAISELTIPFLKLRPFEKPQPKFSIQNYPTNYQKGVVVDGVEWQTDYKQYSFHFENQSKIASINDLRIDLDLVGGIVKNEIHTLQGCESISLSQADISEIGIGNKITISKTIKTYVNNVKISVGRIYPEGYFCIKSIVKVALPHPKNSSISPGYLFVDYRYEVEAGKFEKISKAYPIKYKNIEEGILFIDGDTPLKGPIKRSIQIIPEKPIHFKKSGKVTIDENTK
jgi:hypothetical protein